MIDPIADRSSALGFVDRKDFARFKLRSLSRLGIHVRAGPTRRFGYQRFVIHAWDDLSADQAKRAARYIERTPALYRLSHLVIALWHYAGHPKRKRIEFHAAQARRFAHVRYRMKVR